MPSWPATLPPRPVVDGYSRRPAANVVRTEMDAGTAQQRRATTGRPRPVSCAIVVSDTQKEIFEDFFETTLAAGSLPFDWVQFESGAAVTYRFMHPDPWELAPRNPGATRWRINMRLERLP